ncbi:MAG: polyketide cyclase, partial [Gammaproteobacteria bacterium]|nr:polyketide cyclase [Gammaproteobacteria bacterium]
MTFRIFVLLFSCIASQAFAQQQCEPSKWGAADEIGAANYVTPERVLNATTLV